MTGFSNEALGGIENLLFVCDHILEEDIPEQEIPKMQERLRLLQKQSDDYKKRLSDQGENSMSDLSRRIASLFLEEDRILESFIKKNFTDTDYTGNYSGVAGDINIGALCVEYLTDRARQSIREALIGAMNLKILQRRMDQSSRMCDGQ